MAAFTKTDIVSRAIMLLGNAPIQNLDRPSPIVEAASLLFDIAYPDALCKTNWRFAVKQVQLSQVNETPIVPGYWQYIYNLPGDFLKTIRQYPQNYAWEIFGTQIYSMIAGPLYFEYVWQIPIELCPAPFAMYMYHELAAELSLSNAQNTGYYTALRARADVLLGQAQAAFAQNRPQTPLISGSVLNNRFVSYLSTNG